MSLGLLVASENPNTQTHTQDSCFISIDDIGSSNNAIFCVKTCNQAERNNSNFNLPLTYWAYIEGFVTKCRTFENSPFEIISIFSCSFTYFWNCEKKIHGKCFQTGVYFLTHYTLRTTALPDFMKNINIFLWENLHSGNHKNKIIILWSVDQVLVQHLI